MANARWPSIERRVSTDHRRRSSPRRPRSFAISVERGTAPSIRESCDPKAWRERGRWPGVPPKMACWPLPKRRARSPEASPMRSAQKAISSRYIRRRPTIPAMTDHCSCSRMPRPANSLARQLIAPGEGRWCAELTNAVADGLVIVQMRQTPRPRSHEGFASAPVGWRRRRSCQCRGFALCLFFSRPPM